MRLCHGANAAAASVVTSVQDTSGSSSSPPCHSSHSAATARACSALLTSQGCLTPSSTRHSMKLLMGTRPRWLRNGLAKARLCARVSLRALNIEYFWLTSRAQDGTSHQ